MRSSGRWGVAVLDVTLDVTGMELSEVGSFVRLCQVPGWADHAGPDDRPLGAALPHAALAVRRRLLFAPPFQGHRIDHCRQEAEAPRV